MMPILVKSDNIRSGRKAKAPHGQLQAAQESNGLYLFTNLPFPKDEAVRFEVKV